MILTLLALASGHAAPPPAVDHGRLLAAIAQVEGHKWADPGGAYAFTPATWRQHTRLPYRYAGDPAHAAHVGELHLLWLERELRAADYPVGAYSLAAAWHLGLEGFKRRRAVLDYAVRAENIYRQRP